MDQAMCSGNPLVQKPPPPVDGAKALNELQWAHQTLFRLIEIVQKNAFFSARLSECVVEMGKVAIMLEALIQEQLVNARRRRDD